MKVCHEENDLVGLHKFIVVLFDDRKVGTLNFDDTVCCICLNI